MRARLVTTVVAMWLGAGLSLAAQAPGGADAGARMLAALVAALRPALPYPDATDQDTAADGDTIAAWVVRWPTATAAEPRVVIVANTLNTAVQARARAADAEIQRAVMAVQQRTQNQYDRAVTEFARSGRVEVPVESPTLDDEGLAGARIDAGSRLTVTVVPIGTNQRTEIRSALAPVVFAGVPGATVVRVGENVYRDHVGDDAGTDAGDDDAPHLHVAEARLWFGPVAAPVITEQRRDRYVVSVAPAPSVGAAAMSGVMVHIEGNEALLEHILQKADWSRLDAFVVPGK